VGPFHGYRIPGPQPLDRFGIFLQARHPISLIRTERLELDLAISDRTPEDEFSVDHYINGRQLLSDIERLVQGQQNDPGIQTAVRRSTGRGPAAVSDHVKVKESGLLVG
jgi:hypothetical protein